MSNTETQPKDDEQENKDDVVLSQIGEDPGLSADTIEQDSKARADKENKQGNQPDFAKTKEEEEEEEQQSLPE